MFWLFGTETIFTTKTKRMVQSYPLVAMRNPLFIHMPADMLTQITEAPSGTMQWPGKISKVFHFLISPGWPSPHRMQWPK